MHNLRELAWIIATYGTMVLLMVSCAAPWWEVNDHASFISDAKNGLTWMDGTTRDGGLVSKNNGDAQRYFDIVTALMVLGGFCWLFYLYFVQAYRITWENAQKWCAVAFGVLNFIFVLASVATFAKLVPEKLGFNSFSGEVRANGQHPSDKWGPHAGWCLAVASLFTCLISIGLSVSDKQSKYVKINDTEGGGVVYGSAPANH